MAAPAIGQELQRKQHRRRDAAQRARVSIRLSLSGGVCVRNEWCRAAGWGGGGRGSLCFAEASQLRSTKRPAGKVNVCVAGSAQSVHLRCREGASKGWGTRGSGESGVRVGARCVSARAERGRKSGTTGKKHTRPKCLSWIYSNVRQQEGGGRKGRHGRLARDPAAEHLSSLSLLLLYLGEREGLERPSCLFLVCVRVSDLSVKWKKKRGSKRKTQPRWEEEEGGAPDSLGQDEREQEVKGWGGGRWRCSSAGRRC